MRFDSVYNKILKLNDDPLLISVSDITKHNININRSEFITHVFLLFWLTKIILCKGNSMLGLKNYSKQCLTYEFNQNATALSKTQLLKSGTQSISFKLTYHTITKHVLPWQPNKQFFTLYYVLYYCYT